MQPSFSFFFFNDTATTEIYTLSLHDALPIYRPVKPLRLLGEDLVLFRDERGRYGLVGRSCPHRGRSEEHTSELQSQSNLVCRLLLAIKKRAETRTASSYAETPPSFQLAVRAI